jgi:hypothetical protein
MPFIKHFLFTFALLMALAGCGGSGSGSSSVSNTATTTEPGTEPTTDVDEDPAVVLELVQALFPTNGAKWNDYLAGSHYAVASDTACIAGTSPSCIHGGELRVVDATGKTSCTGLSASDELAAFDWTCDDSSGSARFISTGLADGKYLSDLIDFTAPGFKTNSVTVFDNGTAWASTAASTWWSNSFAAALPGSLINASTIYLLNSPAADRFLLDAAKVSLVVVPGVTLSGPGTAAVSVVDASSFDYLWFEGSIDATGDANAIRLDSVRHATLRNVRAMNGSGIGVLINSGSNNRLSSLTASNNASFGIYFNASNGNKAAEIAAHNNSVGVRIAGAGNWLSGVKASNNSDSGVQMELATNNNLLAITANNNGNYGIDIGANANNNTLSGITASNNGFNGVYLHLGANNNRLAAINANSNTTGLLFNNSNYNTLLGLTTTNNGNYGAYFNNAASNNSLSAIAASNNTVVGVYLDTASDFLISDVATSNNGNIGIFLNVVTDTRFTGRFKTGSNTIVDCDVRNGDKPGLLNGTCANDIGAGSDATLSSGITLANSFIGKVISEDLLNASDVNGGADYATVNASFDWSNFDNVFRSWGIDGAIFPDAFQRGRWTSVNGRIWDWSLATGDTVALDVLPPPDGSMTLTHSWDIGIATPTDDAACDLIVAGAVHNAGACETTYLKHATEIPGDDIGNDNTLCESGETCLYAANIGSYQGQGELISAGAFTAGTLTAITLMRFADNGR